MNEGEYPGLRMKTTADTVSGREMTRMLDRFEGGFDKYPFGKYLIYVGIQIAAAKCVTASGLLAEDRTKNMYWKQLGGLVKSIEAMMAGEYEGIYPSLFDVGTQEGIGLATEAFFWMMMDSVKLGNRVVVANGNMDREGIDFVVSDGSEQWRLDVTSAPRRQVLQAKYRRSGREVLVLPVRNGDYVGSREAVASFQRAFNDMMDLGKGMGVQDLARLGVGRSKLILPEANKLITSTVRINEAIAVDMRREGDLSDDGYGETIRFLTWMEANAYK